MLSILNQALAGLFALFLGTGVASATTMPADEPVRCEIQVTQQGSMMSLQGVYRAEVATTGSYGFQVASSGGGGNSRINQGGGFSAKAGEEVTLGTVMLGANARYDASLTVQAGGERLECAERI
jgi:hypothetical protein